MEIYLKKVIQQSTDSKIWNTEKLQEVVFLIDGVATLSGDCGIALMDAFKQVS